MNKRVQTVVYVCEIILLWVLLGFLLYWRFQVSTTRFFDVDEFTHMHWAANIVKGEPDIKLRAARKLIGMAKHWHSSI